MKAVYDLPKVSYALPKAVYDLPKVSYALPKAVYDLPKAATLCQRSATLYAKHK